MQFCFKKQSLNYDHSLKTITDDQGTVVMCFNFVNGTLIFKNKFLFIGHYGKPIKPSLLVKKLLRHIGIITKISQRALTNGWQVVTITPIDTTNDVKFALYFGEIT